MDKKKYRSSNILVSRGQEGKKNNQKTTVTSPAWHLFYKEFNYVSVMVDTHGEDASSFFSEATVWTNVVLHRASYTQATCLLDPSPCQVMGKKRCLSVTFNGQIRNWAVSAPHHIFEGVVVMIAHTRGVVYVTFLFIICIYMTLNERWQELVQKKKKDKDLCSAHAYCGSGSGMCANRKL